jgi:hypothetical protein
VVAGSFIGSIAAIYQTFGCSLSHFFKSITGKKHKGNKFGLPKFNQKINNQYAELTKTGFSLSGNYVYLAKIGSIKPIWSINLPSAPTSMTKNFKSGTSPRIYPWNQSKI